jgi:hypothetical protein
MVDVDLSKIADTLEALTDAVNTNSAREERLLQLVGKWMEIAGSQVMPLAIRDAYLECAQEVIEIYGSKG